MADASKNDERTLLVVCPTCATRLHVALSHAGRRVRCPDCDTITRAPAGPPEAVKKREQEDPGEYTIRVEQGSVASPPPEQDPRLSFGFDCKTCGTRLAAMPNQVGTDVRCPDCHKYTRVPPAPKVEKKKAPRPVTAYGVGQEPERAPLELFKPPPPPKKKKPAYRPPEPGWMVEGVLTFPWQGHATRHWLMMSLLLVVAGEVTAGFFYLMSLMGQMGMMAPLGFFLGVGWLWMWAYSYCAASFETVVQETVNGGEITSETWVPADWRESIFTFLRILFLTFLVTVIAWGCTLPIAPFVPQSGHLAVALVFVVAWFPILLLASYETDSLFLPYSPIVARSLTRIWPTWMTLWIISALMLGALIVVSAILAMLSPFLVPLVTSPLEAAAILIYARLLGRVGWRVGRIAGERRWKKAQEMGAEIDDAEPEPSPEPQPQFQQRSQAPPLKVEPAKAPSQPQKARPTPPNPLTIDIGMDDDEPDEP